MGRFTGEQLVLAELMNRIISIYYSDSMLNDYKELIMFLADSYSKSFKLGEKTWSAMLQKPLNKSSMYIDEDQISSFKIIMTLLKKSVYRAEFNHFTIVKVLDEVDSSLMKRIEGHNYGDMIDYFEPLGFSKMKNVSVVDKTAIRSIKDQSSIAVMIGVFRLESNPYRRYGVIPLTEMGKVLLSSMPREDRMTEIPSINNYSWTSFIQLVRSIFVNFEYSFGNFQRIKVCDICEKLYFEKKQSTKKYCSKACAQIAFRKSEPPEVGHCRERQNAWIRNRFNIRKANVKLVKNDKIKMKPGYIHKHKCIDCKETKKGGMCEFLVSNNIDFLNLLIDSEETFFTKEITIFLKRKLKK